MPRFRSIRWFLRAQGGAVAVFVIMIFPVLLLIGGLATDVSLLNAQKRYTQSQADLAAQSATRFLPDPAEVRAEVRRIVAANDRYGQLTLADSDIVLGSWSGVGQFTPLANQATPAGATAVRVSVPSPFRPFLWATVFGPDQRIIRREAIGRNQALVVFTLRNRLLGVNTQKSVLDAVLGPLGLGLNTGILQYNGLAGLNVNINDLLGLAAANVDLGALTFDDVLDLPIRIDQLLGGLVTLKALPVGSVLPTPFGLGSLRLRDLLTTSPGVLAARAGDVLPDISIKALDLLTGFAALASRPEQRIGVNAGLDLSPLSAVKLDLGLIRPPVTVIARPGEVPATVAHLDQTSLTVSATALEVIHIGALVEVAEAKATLVSVECGGEGAEAVFNVQTFPAGLDLSLGLGPKLPGVETRTLAPIPVSGSTASLRIPINDIGTPYAVGNPVSLSGALGGVNDALKALRNDAQREKDDICKGLFTCLASLLGSVLGAVLSLVNNVLDVLGSVIGRLDVIENLLNTLLRLLGIDVAPAELILNSVSCAGGGLVE